MFFCVGENNVLGYSIGCGDTIQAAVTRWANSESWEDIAREYSKYTPDIIQGEQVKVDLVYKEPEFVILP